MGINVNDAFPSNYLKAADLQGRQVSVAMANVAYEKMGDDTKLVLYFAGKEKGLVLNKTNANNIAAIYGQDTDGWIGKSVVLVEALVDFQGRSVPAIRVRGPVQTSRPSPNAPLNQSNQGKDKELAEFGAREFAPLDEDEIPF
jgi:arabinogalactan endo-1,4-beta-galactosidase